METRTINDDILRRRQCGACGRQFVSKEFASADLRIPRKRTPEQAAVKAARQRVSIDHGPAGNGLHLQGVWR